MGSKAEAQARTDRIAAFKSELKQLEEDAVVTLEATQNRAIEAYHKRLLDDFAAQYDVDTTSHEKQLSLGMKIASFLGALGLAASLFFLFYQFWGRFSTPLQLAILMAAPVLGLAATYYIRSREKTGYFTKLLAMVTFACFVLNIAMLGEIFNITPSPNAMLVWALFAFLMAYASDTRLMLAMGIISFTAFLSAKAGSWSGIYWIGFGERPENFFPAAAVLFALSYLPHKRFADFRPIYRVFGMLIFFLPVLILSHFGAVSYIDANNDLIEGFYQIVGFALSAGAIWLGIRQGLGDVVNTGNVFFTLFLYTKFFDWWWEWMPKYLFFLLIGLTAILMLLIFKRLRSASSGTVQGGEA